MDKGEYRHYMLKEIFEQPQAIADTLTGTLGDNHVLTAILGPDAESRLADVRHIHIVACGTSFHAGLVARYWIESQAGLACQVEVASEDRYRTVVVPGDHHVLPPILGPHAECRLAHVRLIHLVACGTSFHAGLVARYWIESQAGLPCEVEVASEYRYRTVVVPDNTLLITIYQSGQTAD